MDDMQLIVMTCRLDWMYLISVSLDGSDTQW